MIFAEIIVYAVFIYLAAGALFAVWFAARGVSRLDDAAKDTSFGFRLIVFFGAVAFWVLLARRAAKGEKSPSEKTAHTEFGFKPEEKTNPKSQIRNPRSK
jgi:hypothetical protein